MNRVAPSLIAACVSAILAGCGDSDPPPPADVHGNYTLNVTNGPATCPLPNWMQGAPTPNVPFTVSQNGSHASADVGGAGAIFLGLYSGTAHLEGTVVGSTMDLYLTGTRSLSSGSCAFTIDAHLAANVGTNVISGSISYVPNTNTSADCSQVRNCTASMSFEGTKSP